MTPDDFLRLLVPSIADHFSGGCFPDIEPVSGLEIEETTESTSVITIEGTDDETGVPFYAKIRVGVIVPEHDGRPRQVAP